MLVSRPGTAATPGGPRPETPFRILVLGNFSGQGRPAGRIPFAQRKAQRVDRDNFDEVLAKMAPTVQVPLGPNPQQNIAISFRELEDFEPDRLFVRLSVFESLGNLRQRLQDPDRFADAAAEINSWLPVAEDLAPLAPKPAPVSSENLLDQILGTSEGHDRTGNAADYTSDLSGSSDWDRFLKEIVAPFGIARTDPRLPDLEAVVDEAISARMRSILHHANFQALEAAWRGLFFLVRRLETDANLQLSLLDVTQAELAEDLLNVDDLGTTATYRHLAEGTARTSGDQPWAVVVALSTFGPNQQDLEMLANFARIAGTVRTPFLAAAHSLLLGCPALASGMQPNEWKADAAAQEAWNELRGRPEATFVGLFLPRLLLRLPYGNDSREVEQFSFEEMPPGSPHENYLWGNPALAGALLLGQSFTLADWNLRPGQLLEIAGLPVAFYRHGNESLQKPAAEIVLTEQAAERILDAGLMPLLSIENRDTACLARFQSIAFPNAPLAGPWQ